MYFESHAHYDDKRFKDDLPEVIDRLRESNVRYVINSAANMRSSKNSIDLAKTYDFFYAAVGVHPHDVQKMTEADIHTLRDYAKEKKVVAIGEIGLDYYYEYSDRSAQRFWFKEQLALAKEVDLPVIIHSRDADQECFDLLKENPIPKKGVIHCFSGSKELAKEYVKLGYKLGIGGVVTFSNARKLVETVADIDLSHLLIETDCPYLAPVPNRGQRNDSTNLKYVVDAIATIKGISVSEVYTQTMANGKDLFSV